MFGALLAGMFAGFAVAVPVGVIAVLIIEAGMLGGLRRGFAAGAGAATVDLLFCSLALVVGGLLNQLLAVALVPLQVLSGGILISIGVRGLLSLRASSISGDAAADPRVRGSARQLYLRFIALTAMNPATILYFLALAIGLPGLGSDPINAVAGGDWRRSGPHSSRARGHRNAHRRSDADHWIRYEHRDGGAERLADHHVALRGKVAAQRTINQGSNAITQREPSAIKHWWRITRNRKRDEAPLRKVAGLQRCGSNAHGRRHL
ncbi:hypothetical protein EBU60_02385 [bacterium]|nr:hypothetical protein [bacterium]